MIRRAAAVCLSLVLALPALAQDRSETFLDLLSRVPSDLLAPSPHGTFVQIHFTDLVATAAALEASPALAGSSLVVEYGPYARAQSSQLTSDMNLNYSHLWTSLVGFGPLDLRAHLAITAYPGWAMLLRLEPPTAERVGPALLANGYAAETREGLTAFARNPQDFAIGLDASDPTDPFAGILGRASRVAVDGTLVAQANNWPWLMGLAGAAGPQGHPDLPALAAVLDSPDWGDVALLQALVLADPAVLARDGGEVPRWSLGLLADLAGGTEMMTLVLLTYPDQASAEEAAAWVGAAWGGAPVPSGAGTLEAITGARAEVQVAGDGPFVVVLALRAPVSSVRPDWPVNPQFAALLRAMHQGDLTVLGPA